MHIKTVILLGNFSFGLITFVNLSTPFFIQRFLMFLFFIKTCVFTFFILGINVFYIFAVAKLSARGFVIKCSVGLLIDLNVVVVVGPLSQKEVSFDISEYLTLTFYSY